MLISFISIVQLRPACFIDFLLLLFFKCGIKVAWSVHNKTYRRVMSSSSPLTQFVFFTILLENSFKLSRHLISRAPYFLVFRDRRPETVVCWRCNKSCALCCCCSYTKCGWTDVKSENRRKVKRLFSTLMQKKLCKAKYFTLCERQVVRHLANYFESFPLTRSLAEIENNKQHIK